MSLLSVFKGWLGEAQGAVAHTLFLDDKRGCQDFCVRGLP